MESNIENKIKELSSKIDEMYEMMKKLQIKIDNKIDNKIKESSENWWSIENHFNNILIKFSKGSDFTEFKDHLKELGGTWFVSKKAWKFPIVSAEQVINSIKEKFSNKEFRDIRNVD